jgi:hypothetical protein
MKKLFLITLCLFLVILLQAQVSKTITITAGGLSSALTADEKNTITQLTLTGTIDASDFTTMRDSMPVLSEVDLSGVTIAFYNGTKGTHVGVSYFYAANAIPEYAFRSPGGQPKYSLTSIVFPSTITFIGQFSFYNCNGLKTITIPSFVTSIETNAFASCNGLKTIFIPASVTSIETDAFASSPGVINVDEDNLNYSSLDGTLYNKAQTFLIHCPSSQTGSFTIPPSIKSIGNKAFEYCKKLTSISIPSSVISIGQNAFYYCEGLDTISFPSSLISIGYNAFYHCIGLKTVGIPSSITSIGISAFGFCTGLLNVDENNPNYSSLDGVLYNKAHNVLIQCPVSKTGSFSIPSSVTTIGYSAFMDCSGLTSISIPPSLISIEYQAFRNCTKLTIIPIPSSVTSIEQCAFGNCSGLLNVDGNNKNYSSIDGVLYNKTQTELIQCPISKTGSFIIPSSVTSLGSEAFTYCKSLTNITIPPSVNLINNMAFLFCTGLTSLTVERQVPIDLSTISNVFYNINTNCILYVPYKTAIRYQNADKWQDFTTIVEMDGLFLSDNKMNFGGRGGTKAVSIASSVAWSAVSDQSWLTLNSGSGIKGIDTLTFTATSFSSTGQRSAIVTISATGFDDQTIEIDQFSSKEVTAGGLHNALGAELSSTASLSLIGTIDARDFKTMRDEMPSLTEIDLSRVTIVAYYGTGGTSIFSNYNYPANTIPECAFMNSKWQGKTKLTSVLLPSNMTSFDPYSFFRCTGISTISIPNRVMTIEKEAFGQCSGLITVNFPSSMISIREYAFESCDRLATISIPSSVTSIGSFAFNYCTGLDTVFIPSSVTLIDSLAFEYCTGFMKVDTNNLRYAGVDGILYNKSITELIECPISKTGIVTVPSSVTSIRKEAFFYCDKITNVILPSSLTNIGEAAFTTCQGLATISIPPSVTYIGSYPFIYCTSLSSITVGWLVPYNLGSSLPAFVDVDKTTCTLYVPYGTAMRYRNANQWKDFKTIVEMDGFLVSSDTVILQTPGGSNSNISIAANVPWLASSDQSWLTVSPTDGINDGAITITAISENNGEKRDGTIKVSSNGYSDQLIKVTQNSKIEVTPSSVVLSSKGGSNATLTISSIIPWTVTSNQSWLTILRSSVSNNGSILLIADENIGNTRNATVTISSPGVTDRIINVKQYKTFNADITINYTNETPVIDGYNEELWDSVSKQNIDRPFQSESPTVTATWQALYDNVNFYVLITVDDDNHWPGWKSDGNSGDYDRPEVYWDVNEELKDGKGALNGSGHYLMANGFTENNYDCLFEINPTGINPGGTYSYSLYGESYTYEIAVPLNNLKNINGDAIKSLPNHPIGFDVTIVDQDEGITTSRQRCVWTNDGNGFNGSTDESWNNMDGCGTVLLEDLNSSNQRPIANAGIDQIVEKSALVTLDGSSSTDADGDEITYFWIAPNGITMDDNTSSNPTFTAPETVPENQLVFVLLVNDGKVYSSLDSVIITIQNETIPKTYTVSDVILDNNIIECYNALDTIIVAGDGTTVDFNNGSSVSLIAGQSILFLPGFHAESGSFISAKITIDNEFCEGTSGSIASQPETKSVDSDNQIIPPATGEQKVVKIYPNPNSGQFTVELSNFDNKVDICLYNTLGVKVFQTTTNMSGYQIDLPGIQKGIYFIKVTNGKEQVTKKMVVD